jgi:hypothetical protein
MGHCQPILGFEVYKESHLLFNVTILLGISYSLILMQRGNEATRQRGNEATRQPHSPRVEHST